MEDSEELKIYVKMAKSRIISLYHDTCGACYLSFSGGKDSTVVLALIKECVEEGYILSEIPAVYCDTGIELQATKDFVEWVRNNYYSEIVILKPEKSFSQIIKEYGKPFRSKMKSEVINAFQKNPNSTMAKYCYDDSVCKSKKARLGNKDLHVLNDEFDIKVSNKCCDWLKKKPFKAYAKQNGVSGYFTGMRAAEGGIRQMKYEEALKTGKSPCTTIKGGFTIKSPIIDWSDEITEEYIQKHNVPLSRAYTEYGKKRTGCFVCPYSLEIESDLSSLYQNEPKQYKAAMAWMKDVYIAQNVVLPFDKEYERERERKHGVTNIHVCVTKCCSNTDQIASWSENTKHQNN